MFLQIDVERGQKIAAASVDGFAAGEKKKK